MPSYPAKGRSRPQADRRPRRRFADYSLSILLCCFGGITGFQSPLNAQDANVSTEPSSSMLKIVVIAGEGGVNSLKAKSAIQPIVQVVDAQGQPVPAAVVTFDAPDSGPGVIFSNGGRSQSLISELDGRVTVTGMQPVGLGQFHLTVTAVFDQQFATAIIDQANLQSASASGNQSLTPVARTSESNPKSGVSTRTKYSIIAGIVVAAGVGIAIGVTRGGGSSASTVAGPGNPTVGAPH